MPTLTILGLGPGDAKLLTREAYEVLTTCPTLHVRTRKHPTLKGLPKQLIVKSFDALYRKHAAFDEVYAAIIQRVMKLAEKQDAVYAVPGHPLVGEATTPQLIAQCRERGIAVRIVSGLSFIEPVIEQLALQDTALDPIDGLQIADALQIGRTHHPALNPDKPVLISQIYSRHIAGEVKLALMNQYAPNHEVRVVTNSRVTRVTLHELDHDEFDHLCTLFVPACTRASSFEALQELTAHLRAPEGCPWDKVQTHQSLRNTLLEEAYEVLDAIDHNDLPALKEELGDLLFNVMIQAQIATEAERFRMTDVIAHVHAKLVSRHEHVFGAVKIANPEDVIVNWERLKKLERAKAGARKSALDGIAPALPALARGQKMISRAEKVGFKWPTRAHRVRKVREELAELIGARDDENRFEEFGDLLFTVCNLAAAYKIDAESALREACNKFSRRFGEVERLADAQGADMHKMNIKALLRLWKMAKRSDA